jgi:hypothetical protein
MGSALLRGDVAAAFAYNPVVLIGLAVLGLLGALWTVELLGGPSPDFMSRLRRWAASVHPTRWLAIGLAAGLVYTLLRNLL